MGVALAEGYDEGGFARAEHRVSPAVRCACATSRADHELSQSEIARALRISQMHVSRLLRRARRL
jgi:hypothetical protein